MRPSITPYVMITNEVRTLIADLESRHGKRLPELFIEVQEATEFLLYYAHLSRLDRDLYQVVPRAPANTLFTIWPQDSATVHLKIQECADGLVPVFGLHRARIKQLDGDQRHAIAAMWKKELLHQWEDPNWFLTLPG